MNHLNSLILEGNAVDNAVFNEDAKTAVFTVAVERTYKKSNGETELETSYFDVKTYGVLAEIVAKEVVKGRGVRLVGRLKQERWIDLDGDLDGKKYSKVVVIADHVELKPMAKKEA